MTELLRELCLIDGVSGTEQQVRSFIKKKIAPYCNVTVDPSGNLIAFKKGSVQGEKKIMVCSHMDEVGLIVTGITDEGYLHFECVGGIDNRVLLGKKVRIGEKGVVGILGAKPIHLQKSEEQKTVLTPDDMLIDIGAKDMEHALEHIHIGDTASFVSEFCEFGDGFVKSKAIDDRLGCAIMINMLQKELPYDATFVFTVCEEVGLRGAKTAAFSVKPDFAIVLEATTAADIPGVAPEKQVCRLGDGPVVSFMDRAAIYDKELTSIALQTAKDQGIPCQLKRAIAGGNDAGAIHVSRDGVRTIAISAPCRYLHSPSCVIKATDAQAMGELALATFEAIAEL